MFSKLQIIVILACVAFAACDSESGEKSRPSVYKSKPRYGSGEKDDAKYAFAYRVKAGGAGYGGGDDSDSGEKRGYGGGYKSRDTAEFGHAEQRDYGKTTGKYFVELPDGRLQTVEYVVDGDSGYVAKVSYSGGKADSGELRPAKYQKA